MAYSILVIEDETTLAKNIKVYLERYQYDVHTAANAHDGLRLCETLRPDAVLLDLHLPDQDGLAVLHQLRARDPHLKVIITTAHGNVQIAVQAMKAGAYDYLSKPLGLSELKLLLDKAVEYTRMEGALSYYRAREASASDLSKLLGESAVMVAFKMQLQQLLQAEYAMTDSDLPAVLITGETGTGKELVARTLHYHGRRKDRSLVELNCASIPVHLLEAELFGYEQGAFTDAKGRKSGLFEAADGGTLFLDEIGDLEITLQAKLLKVLEDKTVRRLGGLRDRKVDFRLIAATNQNLEHAVRQGTFRADLYFRLRVIPLAVPPLRERGPDILLLARHFVQTHCRRYGKTLRRFSTAAEAALLRYAWPGNVRELRNVMEQTVLLSQDEVITPEQFLLLPGLAPTPLAAPTEPSRFLLPPQGVCLEELERDLVQQALDRTAGNVTHAAKLLGLSRDTLRYRMEKFHRKAVSPV
jgi:DNA-binding NtrC family response regulator